MTGYFEDFCGNSSLWDKNLFLNSSYPKFSTCFQHTYLVWVPCGLFLLFLPNRISNLNFRKDRLFQPNSRLSVCKTVINWLLCLYLVIDLYTLQDDVIPEYKAIFLASAIKAISFIAAMRVGQMERRKGMVTSGYLFLFWLSVFITEIIPFYTQIIEKAYEVNPNRFMVSGVYWCLIVLQFFLHCFTERKSTSTEGKTGKEPCPEMFASFPSKLSFSWMNSLIFLGYKKDLTEDDLWDLHPHLKGEKVIPQFEAIWNREVESCERYNDMLRDRLANSSNNDHSFRLKSKQPSLFKVIFRLCGKDTLRGIILRTIFDILQLSNPVLLGILISYIQNKSTEHAWKGYALACSFYINAIIMNVLVYHNDINVDTLMMKLKSSLVSAVYKKSLRLDTKAKKSSTAGEIVNYMSVDCGKIQGINWTFMFCLSVPLRFIVCVILLWNTLGPAVFAGMAIMSLLIPITTIISKKEKELNRTLMRHKDERSKLLTEILNEMKVLKFYAWEPSFQQKITDIRNKEINVMKKMRYLDTSYVLTLGLVPFLVALSSFTIYILYQEGNHLDAGKAFMALSLFDNLKFPLYMLPRLISRFLQARVCMARVSKFLQSGEIDPDNVHHKDIQGIAIKVEKGTFSWDEKMEPALQGINIEIPKAKLIAVIGQVGSGKSSLLSAFLGEMDRISGNVNVAGSVAFVPQQAWIQNTKLKENILFGKQLDQDKYDRVIEACCLKSDLDILSTGDMTEIGEKGINLSGGQKQRISLARAVYHNADIYLMDDPLSAVDSHVGKHIFDKVIGENGLLRNKTRILVTHGVHWLPKVDGIIVIKDGRISETGTYDELVNHNGAFAQFLKNYQNEPADIDSNELEIIEDCESTNPDYEKFKQNKTSISFEKTVRNQFSVIRRRKVFGRSISSYENCSLDDSLTPKQFEMMMDDVDKEDILAETTTEDGSRKDKQTYEESTKESTLHLKSTNVEERLEENSETEVGELIGEEETEIGQVKFSVFWKYFQAYGYVWIIVIFVVAVINEIIRSGTNIMLSRWTEDPLLKNITLTNTTEYKSQNLKFIALYAAFGMGETFFDIAYTLMVFLRSVIASERLHSAMLKNILHCPMSFFDTTPVGRILNRFTCDVEKIDNDLPHQIRGVFYQVLHAVTTLAVISYNTPVFVTIIIPAVILYRLIRKYFVPTIRQLERIHGKTRSPVYSHFGETITGVSTIRAYGLQDKFIKDSQRKVDKTILSLYTLIAAHKWSGLRLECVGNLFVWAAALFAVMSCDISGGMAGLCVAYALQILRFMIEQVHAEFKYTDEELRKSVSQTLGVLYITGALNGLVNTSANLEINAVSLERIKQYLDIKNEAALVNENNRPSKDWPIVGNISIQNFQTRYRPGLDLVLRGITCNISGGEKVGVVGRTGAGKSSLMSALFRLIESVDGKIEIDGQNIAQVGLHDLRTKLTILPQEPVLFSGTLRMNLDPFDNYTIDALWKTLEHAHLKKFVSKLPNGLQHECGERGQNLSVGQRQLVCLARALLNKSKILILDEATAAVDMATDDLIQKTIRTEFKNCTILAIAHRLKTIIDYDKVLVLGHGSVLEYDSPEKLLKNQQSVFYKMAKESNIV